MCLKRTAFQSRFNTVHGNQDSPADAQHADFLMSYAVVNRPHTHAKRPGGLCFRERYRTIYFRILGRRRGGSRPGRMQPLDFLPDGSPDCFENRFRELVQGKDLTLAIDLNNKLDSHGSRWRLPRERKKEKRATRISSGQTAACRATPTQRFCWILWLLWMLPTGAGHPSCEVPIPPFRLCNWRTPFHVPRKHRKSSGASKWLSWSLCRREGFLSQCGAARVSLCRMGLDWKSQHLLRRTRCELPVLPLPPSKRGKR